MHDQGEYGDSFRGHVADLFRLRSPMYCKLCGEGGRPVPCGDPSCATALDPVAFWSEGFRDALRKGPDPLEWSTGEVAKRRREVEASEDGGQRVDVRVAGVAFEGRQVRLLAALAGRDLPVHIRPRFDDANRSTSRTSNRAIPSS